MRSLGIVSVSVSVSGHHHHRKGSIIVTNAKRNNNGVIAWRCSPGCGACCKLDKGPKYPSPQEIFPDDPHLVEMVESMIGDDGWCKHYDHQHRTCSIYSERPSFCRVEPEVFLKLYGIQNKNFHSEACRACRDTIKSIYGPASQELKNFSSNLAKPPAH